MLAALQPPKRERPLVAIAGISDATETTDYLMPAGIVRRSDIADVVMLATGPGSVTLYPTLTVEADGIGSSASWWRPVAIVENRMDLFAACIVCSP